MAISSLTADYCRTSMALRGAVHQAQAAMAAAAAATEGPSPIAGLSASNVRWYYQDCEAAAGSDPTASTTSTTSSSGAGSSSAAEWLPFCCHDSLRLEKAYQQYLLAAPVEPGARLVAFSACGGVWAHSRRVARQSLA